MVARKQQTPPPIAQPEPEQPEPQQPGQFIEDDEWTPPYFDIDQLAAQYSTEPENSIKFQVFREGPKGYRDVRLIAEMPPEEFSLGMLQHSPYGGGKFRVYIRSKTGLVRNLAIEVEPAPSTEKIIAAPSGDGQLAAAIAAMSNGFAQLGQLITANRAPASDGMGVEQVLKLIGTLQPILAGVHAPQKPEVDPLEMIKKIMELQRSFTPPSGEATGESVLIAAIENFGKPLMDMMAKSQQQPAAIEHANPAQRALPTTPSEVATAAKPAQSSTTDLQEFEAHPEGVDMSSLSMKLTVMKPVILMMAANDKDPSPYAEMIIQALTPEEIEKYINAPDWWQQLVPLMPEIESFKPWFDELREVVLKIAIDLASGDLETPEAPKT